MKRFYRYARIAALLLLLCIMISAVSAAPKTTPTPKPTATAPPVLQACSHATFPVADFTCSFLENQSETAPDGPPFPITCIDNSTAGANQSISSWRWEFGDGESSAERSPRHSYTSAGLYEIQMTVTTFCGSKYSNTTNRTLPVYCSIPQPGFMTNVTDGIAPLAVQVTDTSQNTPLDITTWTYWFDDMHFSNQRNPVFVFTVPGRYTINQTVMKGCVQIGSTVPVVAERRILVKSPLGSSIDLNSTNTTPAANITTTVTPAIIPVVSETIAPTETIVSNKGTLSVDTNPTGAQVFIDDILRGTTPATIQDIPSGPHTLRLVKEGYVNMTMSVSIIGGKDTTLSTSLMTAGSSGIALLPVVVMSVIMVGIVVFGVFLFLRHRAQQED